jgi:hypothetical protein
MQTAGHAAPARMLPGMHPQQLLPAPRAGGVVYLPGSYPPQPGVPPAVPPMKRRLGRPPLSERDRQMRALAAAAPKIRKLLPPGVLPPMPPVKKRLGRPLLSDPYRPGRAVLGGNGRGGAAVIGAGPGGLWERTLLCMRLASDL